VGYRWMQPWKQSVFVAALSLALTAIASAGPIVDRVVTNVNGHVVLQSDWEQEVAFEALMDGRTPDSFTTAERKAALDRLIDQELLREQVRPGDSLASTDISARVAAVRKLLPEAATDDGWHATLQRYGLTQKALEKRLSDEIQLMKLVEDRLRPSIQIDQQAVERYYHDELLPQIKKTGDNAKPLVEVYAKIRTLLAEKKMNELLTGWLASLRSGSHIRTPDSNSGDTNR
jgi:hypothetical protein